MMTLIQDEKENTLRLAKNTFSEIYTTVVWVIRTRLYLF